MRLTTYRSDGKTGKKGNRKPHARLGMGRVPIGFVSLSGHGGISLGEARSGCGLSASSRADASRV